VNEDADALPAGTAVCELERRRQGRERRSWPPSSLKDHCLRRPGCPVVLQDAASGAHDHIARLWQRELNPAIERGGKIPVADQVHIRLCGDRPPSRHEGVPVEAVRVGGAEIGSGRFERHEHAIIRKVRRFGIAVAGIPPADALIRRVIPVVRS
jgi:hypothetical protein